MAQQLQVPQRVDVEPAAGRTEGSGIQIPQYTIWQILSVWLIAALPMALLAWVAAPRIAPTLTGQAPLVRALIVCLTIGLIWQFVVVAILVGREQSNLRWSTVREALWLSSPRSPKTGRTGGRLWLLVIPLILAFGAEELIPSLTHPAGRDFGLFLASHSGQTFMHGAWGWFAILIVMLIFNTVLGEELLFRGFLLPRMNGVFGRADWLANGVLFALYHLHIPWVMPAVLFDALILAYPSKRYRSAWLGIIVHSAQSIFIATALLALVVRS
jgi:uncharacterized protein